MKLTPEISSERPQLRAFMVPRRYFRYLFLALFLTLTFGTFRYFPGMALLNELWLVVAFAFLAIPYLYWKARGRWRFTLFELYLLAMMAVIPLLAGVTAWREFGQPTIYGVLAQRRMILGAGALAVIYAFRQNRVALIDIEKTLVILVWSSLLLYQFVMVWFAREFTFDNAFIVFGLYYYAFVGFRQKSKKHYLLALLLLAYLVVGVGGRSLLVSVLAAFLLFVYRWGSPARLVLFTPRLVAVGLLFMALLYVTNAEYVALFLAKLSDAFTVVLTGKESQDVSANARLSEFTLVVPYIQERWLFGNGDISNQWHGGYEGVLGGYFYPSDIGIVGVLYMYGLVGTLLFAVQFLFAWRYAKPLTGNHHRALVDAIKGFLLYYAIHSLVTGRFAHHAEISFMFIALLWCITFERRGSGELV